MKAVRFHEYGDPGVLRYEDVALPVPGAGQVRIKLNMHIRGTDMTLDFEGTDYQVQAAFNVPTWNQRGHYMICFPILNFFRTLDPQVPYNSGLVRPIALNIPRGTIMNPEIGAAYGVRAATMFRVLDIINGCLAQALPEVIPAASSGGIAIVLVSTLDPGTGERRISVAQPRDMAMPSVTPAPMAIPAIPPSVARISDSVRNCAAT